MDSEKTSRDQAINRNRLKKNQKYQSQYSGGIDSQSLSKYLIAGP